VKDKYRSVCTRCDLTINDLTKIRPRNDLHIVCWIGYWNLLTPSLIPLKQTFVKYVILFGIILYVVGRWTIVTVSFHCIIAKSCAILIR